MSQAHAIDTEFTLKSRLANKIALIVQDKGIEASDAAKVTGLSRAQTEQVLEGFVQDIPLFSLIASLAALGQDVTISTAPAVDEDGGVFVDLDDEA